MLLVSLKLTRIYATLVAVECQKLQDNQMPGLGGWEFAPDGSLCHTTQSGRVSVAVWDDHAVLDAMAGHNNELGASPASAVLVCVEQEENMGFVFNVENFRDELLANRADRAAILIDLMRALGWLSWAHGVDGSHPQNLKLYIIAKEGMAAEHRYKAEEAAVDAQWARDSLISGHAVCARGRC